MLRVGAQVAAAPVVVVVVVAATASACMWTPDAADLQREAELGPRMTESEAAAAVVAYIDLVNGALQGESVGSLADATAPSCRCYALVEMIQEGTSGGGAFVGARFKASDIAVTTTRAGVAKVRARVDVTAYDVKSPDGLLVDRVAAENYLAVYILRTDEDGWRVANVVPVE